jgi:hypothetical protein
MQTSPKDALSAEDATGGQKMQIQPEGVRVSLAEGQAALTHAKPARLAAATIKTMDPER